VSLLECFPAGARPRPEQRRLLAALEEALAESDQDAATPRVLLVEAPPGVGKSHVVMALARWSEDAYLLTSQKLLQDQYEREFGAELQVVKGRDNYACERYADTHVPTSRGLCRRRRGVVCACPYARAKQAAINGPIFCTNTWYFATLRHWHAETLRRRKLLIIDEAHHLEAQLVHVCTARFSYEEMKAWFGGPLPRLDDPAAYRELMLGHEDRLAAALDEIEFALATFAAADADDPTFLAAPPAPVEQALLDQCDSLSTALARIRAFAAGDAREWIVRYPDEPAATLELLPLTVAEEARAMLEESAPVTVLSSAYLGAATAVAAALGVAPEAVRSLAVSSPFSLEQRPIVYRPVGALSRATVAVYEPALLDAVAAILRQHRADKGLIHVASYAAGHRLVRGLHACAPEEAGRLLLVASAELKTASLDQHRASAQPTVLVAPSLREGVDLPDDFLRFQVVTKMPFPDLGDPWIQARHARDPRWYALETATAFVQAYGRSCRHAEDWGVTYVLDGALARFVQRYRVLLPDWVLAAVEPALRTVLEAPAE